MEEDENLWLLLSVGPHLMAPLIPPPSEGCVHPMLRILNTARRAYKVVSIPMQLSRTHFIKSTKNDVTMNLSFCGLRKQEIHLRRFMREECGGADMLDVSECGDRLCLDFDSPVGNLIHKIWGPEPDLFRAAFRAFSNCVQFPSFPTVFAAVTRKRIFDTSSVESFHAFRFHVIFPHVRGTRIFRHHCIKQLDEELVRSGVSRQQVQLLADRTHLSSSENHLRMPHACKMDHKIGVKGWHEPFFITFIDSNYKLQLLPAVEFSNLLRGKDTLGLLKPFSKAPDNIEAFHDLFHIRSIFDDSPPQTHVISRKRKADEIESSIESPLTLDNTVVLAFWGALRDTDPLFQAVCKNSTCGRIKVDESGVSVKFTPDCIDGLSGVKCPVCASKQVHKNPSIFWEVYFSFKASWDIKLTCRSEGYYVFHKPIRLKDALKELVLGIRRWWKDRHNQALKQWNSHPIVKVAGTLSEKELEQATIVTGSIPLIKTVSVFSEKSIPVIMKIVIAYDSMNTKPQNLEILREEIDKVVPETVDWRKELVERVGGQDHVTNALAKLLGQTHNLNLE